MVDWIDEWKGGCDVFPLIETMEEHTDGGKELRKPNVVPFAWTQKINIKTIKIIQTQGN